MSLVQYSTGARTVRTNSPDGFRKMEMAAVSTFESTPRGGGSSPVPSQDRAAVARLAQGLAASAAKRLDNNQVDRSDADPVQHVRLDKFKNLASRFKLQYCIELYYLFSVPLMMSFFFHLRNGNGVYVWIAINSAVDIIIFAMYVLAIYRSYGLRAAVDASPVWDELKSHGVPAHLLPKERSITPYHSSLVSCIHSRSSNK